MSMTATQQTRELSGYTTRLLVLGIVAIFLMSMDHRGHYLQALRNQAAHLTIPLYRALDWPQRALSDGLSYLTRQGELLARITELQAEQTRLRGELLQLATVLQENRELRELLEGVDVSSSELILADLVQVSMDPFSHRVVINRGLSSGVEVGMAVVDQAGLLGQVTESTLSGASVTLITDANHALPVRNLRNGVRTIAYGTGDLHVLAITDLPRNTDLTPGDLLVTSGLGSRFPTGLPVAEVIAIEVQDADRFARVRARPLAAMDQARQVLIVR